MLTLKAPVNDVLHDTQITMPCLPAFCKEKRQLMCPESLRDGNAPSHAEGARGDLQAGSSLPPLVFGEIDFVQNVMDRRGIEAFFDDLPRA